MPDGTRRLSSSTIQWSAPVAHQVDAGHRDPHRVRRHELAQVAAARGLVDDRGGDDAVGDDLPLAVDVAQERLERADALGEPGR